MVNYHSNQARSFLTKEQKHEHLEKKNKFIPLKLNYLLLATNNREYLESHDLEKEMENTFIREKK